MEISFNGKKVSTELSGLSTSISRYAEETIKTVPGNPNDSVKVKSTLPTSPYSGGSVYISIDAKNISNELLQILAKKSNAFDGIVTIVDSYNKLPTKTVSFTKATLYSYSDQVSAGYYGDSYGAVSISLNCKTFSINGILIEQ